MLWSRGLVGYWPLENSALDASGNGRNGTVYGASYTDGKLGRCLSFDGNDYVSIGTLDLKGEFTIALWVKPSQISGGDRWFIANSNVGGDWMDYALAMSGSTGKVKILWGGPPYFFEAGNGALSTTAWRHVAVTRAGTSGNWTVRLYLDGQEDKNWNTTIDPSTYSNPCLIGLLSLVYERFQGLLDEPSLWNRALSATDIRRVMMGTQPIG